MISTKFEELFSLENIYKAHIKGRLSKRAKRPIVRYEMSLLQNVVKLYNELHSGSYKISHYNSFVVYEPKKREIQTLHYSDRVVQHVICDSLLSPYFTRHAICDNGVCQICKGTHFLLRRLEVMLRKFISKNWNSGYVLKCDIHKYFPSIPHKKLEELVLKHIKDKKLKAFISMIIDSYHTHPNYLEKNGISSLGSGEPHPKTKGVFVTNRGIPIGNQTSQVFGMFFLNDLDRFIKEKLRFKIYSRYMDDFILVHKDKEVLKQALSEIQKLVNELHLKLNSKTQIFPLKNGFTYLGFRYQVVNGKLLKKVSRKTTRRFCARARLLNRAFADGAIDAERVRCSLSAYHGHLKHGNCYKLEQKLFKRIKIEEIQKSKELKNGTNKN